MDLLTRPPSADILTADPFEQHCARRLTAAGLHDVEPQRPRVIARRRIAGLSAWILYAVVWDCEPLSVDRSQACFALILYARIDDIRAVLHSTACRQHDRQRSPLHCATEQRQLRRLPFDFCNLSTGLQYATCDRASEVACRAFEAPGCVTDCSRLHRQCERCCATLQHTCEPRSGRAASPFPFFWSQDLH
jgi:hypothetical protein